ncbi:MAG: SRPBCC family protein [Hyphomicrobiaceae bacterium]|nr:SRPBCC family protein [Hyphomicrobiaceae bacterium]
MSLLFLLTTAIVLAALVVLALASGKPDRFVVERRAMIAAPVETVYAQVADLVAWQAWSPWAKKDPAAKAEISGPSSGVGSAFAWDGNKDVGKGRMEIIEALPPSRVKFRLDFEKPFKGTNEAQFILSPVQGGTDVVWQMTGDAVLVSKVMDLLFNMDRMVGRDFEAGLSSIKQICERKAA